MDFKEKHFALEHIRNCQGRAQDTARRYGREDDNMRLMKRNIENEDADNEVEYILGAVNLAAALLGEKERKRRRPDRIRDRSWFQDGYRNWDDELFKKLLRIKTIDI